MRKIAAAVSVISMSLALAACGGNGAEPVAANDTLANETVLNDEVPADGNLATFGNGADALPADNALGGNAL
ncbi:hypothetical protein COA17_00205 [Sphingomonas ginsenosidimutans]|jgi:hypothetical protein|uniref:Argininosuccinate lyase n=1 Tax=Sphingomonas ginsenosidimutans TaxID=862134 RepID=A0A2A4HZZ2_9SPHN|nr:hypothetical protein [Sphingomonas ginsenosidimutans]MEE2916067.1 hypothetical protein [Pseudomonadota bacterium]PCG09944.1 hypothetical protein COA17_00205 [Sphingomonas ginsenosidimutans]